MILAWRHAWRGRAREILAVLMLAVSLCAAMHGEPAHAQARAGAPAGMLELAARPRAGQVIRLELRKDQERQGANQALQRSSSLLRVTVEVLEADARGMLVRWSPAPAQPPGSAQHDGLAGDTEAIWALMRDIHYELEFDAHGQLLQLRNFDALRPVVSRLLDELETVLAGRGDPEAARQAMALVRRTFASRANLEALLLREPRMFFFPLGKSVPLEAPLEYDSQLPNPFGGAALPAHGSLRVDWVDRNRGLAAITLEQDLHPDSARMVLEALIARLPPANRPKDADLSGLKVEIRDQGRYSVNLADGLPERVDFTRIARVPGGFRRDVLGMRRVQ